MLVSNLAYSLSPFFIIWDVILNVHYYALISFKFLGVHRGSPMKLGLLPPPTCVSVFSIASFLVKLVLQLILIQAVHHKEAKISKDKSLPSCSSLSMSMNVNKIRAVTL